MSIYSKDASINTGDLTQTEIHLYGSSRLGVYNLKNNVQRDDPNPGRIITFTRGNKFFELSNHLGNVLATVSDKKQQHSSDNATVDYFTADVVSANDYYPFGMLMPGRKYSVANTNYRFRFNGKENDNEVKGEGNQQDYGMRIYDPRLGRFLSVDPITKDYPELTPYQFSSNSPIQNIDLDGLEGSWAGMGQNIPKDQWDSFHKGYNKTLQKGTLVTVIVAIDVFVTKGWLSRIAMGSQFLGAFEHNRAQNPQSKTAQDNRSKDALSNAFITFGVGKLIGGAINIFRGPVKEEINYLFRGTTEGFPGSNALQKLSITPTSSDPAVATIFSIAAGKNGSGIVQIALPSNLGKVSYSANVLKPMENEIGVGLSPTQFTSRTSLTLTKNESVDILKGMGVRLPEKINIDEISNVLKKTPKMSKNQIDAFYKKALEVKKAN